MKLIIQNGCVHQLNRTDMDLLLPLFPAYWSNGVNAITFYQGRGKGIYTEYYKKEKMLGLFWPKDEINKTNALQELLIGLECVAENGEIPQKITAARRQHLADKTAHILQDCIEKIEGHGRPQNKSVHTDAV